MSEGARLKFAERSMSAFWSAYESGHLAASMEVVQGLGYSALTIGHVFNPESYYFPNARNGRLVRPKGVEEGRIPILSLKPGQSLQMPQPHSFHPIQEANMTSYGYSEAQINEFKQEASQIPLVVNRADGKHVVASVLSVCLLPEKANPDFKLKTLPSMVFKIPNRPPAEAVCPGAVLHELVHVLQELDDPIGEDNGLDLELEAYSAQAKLLWSSDIEFSLNTAMATDVDAVRKKYLGVNNYRSDDSFRQLVKDHPTLHRII